MQSLTIVPSRFFPFLLASVVIAGILGASCGSGNSGSSATVLGDGDGSTGGAGGNAGVGGMANPTNSSGMSGNMSTGGSNGTLGENGGVGGADSGTSGSPGTGGVTLPVDSGSGGAGSGGTNKGVGGSPGTGGTTVRDGGSEGAATDVVSLCSENCDHTVSLNCPNATKCAGACKEWYRDSSDECRQHFLSYIRCAAPHPASDFTCGCCGWVVPNPTICKSERENYERCIGLELQ